MEQNQTLVLVAAASTLPSSQLLGMPGEIRNRIYDLVLGTKPLHPVPEYSHASSRGLVNSAFRRTTAAMCDIGVRNMAKRGLYTLRQVCRQIAGETEHYLFCTLDLSNLDGFICNRRNHEDINAHHELFEDMLKGRWHYVRHMVIASYSMGPLLDKCRRLVPDFPLPAVTAAYVHKYTHYSNRILWPADARNLTTLTIHDMHRRTAEERERLLKVLGFYFPKLKDVRCSYEGDNGCSRRYRISNGELKWWYTGEVFKKLPEELTAEEWFGVKHGTSDGGS